MLRRRDAAARVPERGFRAPLYPWSVGAFVLAAAYVVAGAIASNPANAVRGTLLLLLGVPAFAYWRRARGTGPAR